MSKRFFHVTDANNVPAIQAEGLKPQIGTLADMHGETEEKVYLFGSMGDVENALMNWLGLELGDIPRIAILEVALPDDIRVIGEAFEFQVSELIPSTGISVVTLDADSYFIDAPAPAVEAESERSAFTPF